MPIVFECRPTGSDLNGGGETLIQHDSTAVMGLASADFSVTDLTANWAIHDYVESTAGTFSASSNGRIMNISSGTNFVPGFYKISWVLGVDTYHRCRLDRNPTNGSPASGGVARVGGALYTPPNVPSEWGECFAWLLAGTYAFSGGVSAGLTGIIGYSSTRGDSPIGTSRPLCQLGTANWQGDGLENLRITGAHPALVSVRKATVNCHILNSTTGPATALILQDDGAKAVDCQVSCSNGKTISVQGAQAQVVFCRIHDSTVGLEILGARCIIADNYVDSCVEGIKGTAMLYPRFLGNTIYNSDVGLRDLGSGGCGVVAVNNIFDSNTTAVSWAEAHPGDFWDYNNYNGNGTDVVNVTKGPNDTALVPGFTDAANGDFSLALASPLRTRGFSTRLGVGS